MEKAGEYKTVNKIKCWICGKEGDSGEHMIKASDLRLYFPDVSQKKPLYLHNSKRRNKRIGSIKSSHLKSDALLCRKCNNELTQPYDKAWEKLSRYLYRNLCAIEKSKSFSLKKAFPGGSNREARYVQLFFMKLTGCLLIEAGHYNLARDFADYLQKGLPREDVMLKFSLDPMDLFGVSDLEVYKDDNKGVLQLGWIYSLGKIAVTIRYFSDVGVKPGKSLGWFPSRKSKKILLSDF